LVQGVAENTAQRNKENMTGLASYALEHQIC